MSEMIEYSQDDVIGDFLINTFDDTPDNARLVYNATSNAASMHEHLLDNAVEVAGVILERGQRTDRATGVSVPCVNSYIVDVEGNAYYSQSAGVAQGLAKIARLTNNFRDTDGGRVKIVIREKSLRNGNTLKVVEWL